MSMSVDPLYRHADTTKFRPAGPWLCVHLCAWVSFLWSSSDKYEGDTDLKPYGRDQDQLTTAHNTMMSSVSSLAKLADWLKIVVNGLYNELYMFFSCHIRNALFIDFTQHRTQWISNDNFRTWLNGLFHETQTISCTISNPFQHKWSLPLGGKVQDHDPNRPWHWFFRLAAAYVSLWFH